MTTYLPDGDGVLWITEHGNARLPLSQCERLLSIFQSVGAAKPFNALHEAMSRCEGFIPVVSGFRPEPAQRAGGLRYPAVAHTRHFDGGRGA